jgi:hypothetical protein
MQTHNAVVLDHHSIMTFHAVVTQNYSIAVNWRFEEVRNTTYQEHRPQQHTVHPSFNQKCSQVAFDTQFPVQLWEISCATTLVAERSPVSKLGVRNVMHGFSMPPYGKEGGSTSMSYCPHMYGIPVISSAAQSRLINIWATTLQAICDSGKWPAMANHSGVTAWRKL